jgi:hypothetical protein
MKKPYIVTLDKSNDAKWKKLKLEPIYTAGEYFLLVLIHKLEHEGCLIPYDISEIIGKELKTTLKIHHQLFNEIKISDQSELIYCLSYQDGIIHAFEHFLHHISYGESLCKAEINSILRVYERLIKQKQSNKKWLDVAYLKGYLNGYLLVLLNKNERKAFPYYLDLGLNNELRTFDEYANSLTISKGRRKSITEYASNLIAKKKITDGIIPQHTPFL